MRANALMERKEDAGKWREPSLLIGPESMAQMLGCSARHVRRLVDAGRAPRPLRLGRLLRWPRAQIEEWIANGCPAVRKGVGR